MKDIKRSAYGMVGAGALTILFAGAALGQTANDRQDRRNSRETSARSTTDSAAQRTNWNRGDQQTRSNATRTTAPQLNRYTAQAGSPSYSSPRVATEQPQRNSSTIQSRSNTQWNSDSSRSTSWSSGSYRQSSQIRQQPSERRSNDSRSFDDGQRSGRISASGRISNVQRERDGYRIRLENRADSFWIPAARIRSGVDLRVGLGIELGGIFSDGLINVDAINPGYGYAAAPAGLVTGTVEQIDFSSGTLWLRDAASGQVLAVDMSRAGIDLRSLQPGDAIRVSGDFTTAGSFIAYGLDNVGIGRY